MNKKELDAIKRFIKEQIIVYKEESEKAGNKLYGHDCTLDNRIEYAMDKAHYSGKFLAYAECFALIEDTKKAIKFFKSLKWNNKLIEGIIKGLELYKEIKRDANKSKNKATGNEIKKADNRENN